MKKKLVPFEAAFVFSSKNLISYFCRAKVLMLVLIPLSSYFRPTFTVNIGEHLLIERLVSELQGLWR